MENTGSASLTDGVTTAVKMPNDPLLNSGVGTVTDKKLRKYNLIACILHSIQVRVNKNKLYF